jgi:uncharacterized protein YjiK
MPVFKITSPVFLLFMLICLNCKNQVQYKSPAGYDLNKPEKFVLNNALHEISGITFLNGKSDTIFSIEDETAKLFSYSFGSNQFSHSKFGKKGDYEDVTVLGNNSFVVLRSDGSLFKFSTAAIGKEKIDSVKEYNNILPEGEYEGISAAAGKLFVLCKNCPGDNQKKEVSVFTLEQVNDSAINITNTFKINLSMLQLKENTERKNFHPSGLAKNPVTKDWFIISSVNKLLLVLDEQWKVKEFYPLDPSLFNQPEGIAFADNGDLYISNEGGEGVATILLFRYHKQ